MVSGYPTVNTTAGVAAQSAGKRRYGNRVGQCGGGGHGSIGFRLLLGLGLQGLQQQQQQQEQQDL